MVVIPERSGCSNNQYLKSLKSNLKTQSRVSVAWKILPLSSVCSDRKDMIKQNDLLVSLRCCFETIIYD